MHRDRQNIGLHAAVGLGARQQGSERQIDDRRHHRVARGKARRVYLGAVRHQLGPRSRERQLRALADEDAADDRNQHQQGGVACAMARKPATANTISVSTPVPPSAVTSRTISSNHLGPIGIGEIAGRAQGQQQPFVEGARAAFAHLVGELGEGEQHRAATITETSVRRSTPATRATSSASNIGLLADPRAAAVTLGIARPPPPVRQAAVRLPRQLLSRP